MARRRGAVPQPALRPADSRALSGRGDHPRLHPPDVPAVPAQPAGHLLRPAVHVVGDAAGAAGADGVGGVEARHPPLLPHPVRQGDGHLQRHRRSLPGAAAGRRGRAHPRAVPAARTVRALRRQRQAAQEPRAADRGGPSPARERLRLAQAADHRQRHLEVRRAAARHPHAQPAPLRAVPRLRARRDAARPLSPGLGVRLPVAVRGLRPAAARGDGVRRAGRHLEHVVAARSGRRRRRARRSDRLAGHRRRPGARAGRWQPARRSPAARRRPGPVVLVDGGGPGGPPHLRRRASRAGR